MEELLHNRLKYLQLFDVAYHTTSADNTTYVDKYTRCNYDEYVEDMSKDGTYGDELALQAFANLSSLSIRIISSTNGEDTANTVFMPTGPMKGRVTIVNRNSEHFYGCKWVSSEPRQPPNLQTVPALQMPQDASSNTGGAPANAVGGELLKDTSGGRRVATGNNRPSQYEGKLVVASWNVTTLSARNNKSADDYMGKLGVFTSLFLDYGLDIIAMQETRSAESGVREAGQYGYAVYLSGGVGGKRRYGGVGFAVRDAINTLTLEFHPCSERLAWIGGDWGGFPMAIFCVYAPTQASSENDSGAATLEFYTMLGQAIDDLPVRYGKNYCVCGDFNARVGTSSLEEEDPIIRTIRGNCIVARC